MECEYDKFQMWHDVIKSVFHFVVFIIFAAYIGTINGRTKAIVNILTKIKKRQTIKPIFKGEK